MIAKRMLDIDVAERLRMARLNAGYDTMIQVERVCGINRNELARIENGVHYPQLATLCRLCRLYRITPNDILL